MSCLFHWGGSGSQKEGSECCVMSDGLCMQIATVIQECGLFHINVMSTPPFGWLTRACCSQMNSYCTALALIKTLCTCFVLIPLNCTVLRQYRLWNLPPVACSGVLLEVSVFPVVSFTEISRCSVSNISATCQHSTTDRERDVIDKYVSILF